MKIYEALKEMIEHGKTIKRNWKQNKIGQATWETDPVLLEKDGTDKKWKVDNLLMITNNDLFSDDWKVVEEEIKPVIINTDGGGMDFGTDPSKLPSAKLDIKHSKEVFITNEEVKDESN